MKMEGQFGIGSVGGEAFSGTADMLVSRCPLATTDPLLGLPSSSESEDWEDRGEEKEDMEEEERRGR